MTFCCIVCHAVATDVIVKPTEAVYRGGCRGHWELAMVNGVVEAIGPQEPLRSISERTKAVDFPQRNQPDALRAAPLQQVQPASAAPISSAAIVIASST